MAHQLRNVDLRMNFAIIRQVQTISYCTHSGQHLKGTIISKTQLLITSRSPRRLNVWLQLKIYQIINYKVLFSSGQHSVSFYVGLFATDTE